MSFEKIMNENVVIFDENDNKVAEAKASVQKDNIYIKNKSDVIIREGFFIERKLPSKEIEKYRVIDYQFIEKIHSIPAIYKIDVEKNGRKKITNTITEAPKIIITGGVNQIATNTHNTTMHMNYINNISKLKDIISNSALTLEEKKEANEIIDSVEVELNSNNYKKSVVKALLNSLPKIDNVASIINSLLSTLH